MKYTTKVKADLAVIISLLLLLTLLVGRMEIDKLSPILLLALWGALFATASVWNRHTRHLSHWEGIWARPKTEIIAMCVMFVACIFITFSLDVDIHFLDYSLILIMGLNFVPMLVRTYLNAEKYDMDHLNSLQELVEKYPETEDMLTKKARAKLRNRESSVH